ncbi:MAG: zinc ribbon domain-containing protein, partial [Oscillospiraceae bacterium]|nr:zinc ribbon domain-containing protein [Oscillospiraceae bacterium]
HHVGIIDRQTFDTVQAEMARRNAGRSPSKKSAPTGRTSYASKYALSERLVCGECGTLYRRCTWAKRGRKRTVWRCVSRLDYGAKYCHDSPTLDEEPLQRAVLTAISKAMSSPDELIRQIVNAMEKEVSPLPGQLLSLADIERRLTDLEIQFNQLLEQAAEQTDGLDCMERFQAITQEIAALKQQRTQVETLCRDSDAATKRLNKTVSILENASPKLQHWDETVIRQLVDTVKVISAEKIIVYLRGGAEIEQAITE